MVSMRNVLIGQVAAASVTAAGWYPSLQVRSAGVPIGQFKNVSGIQIYHSYPPGRNSSTKAILYLSDIFGLPMLENKLLADSFASNDYLVIMPDLFNGDPITLEQFEAGLNLTGWLPRHPPEEIDRIINVVIKYMKEDLKVERIGGVGYCFGGRYVPRFLAAGQGLDAGYIAHPSALSEEEIGGIRRPISIAAGTLDSYFNVTAKFRAETILNANNVTFQTNLYYAAPHTFATRIDQSIPQQVYAKQASFVQAVTWFDFWL